MSDVAKLITLTSKGASSGPNYEVYYSLDCVNYTASVPFVIALPDIGSTGSVLVPFETRCIQLKNTNDDCGNSVTHSTFPLPTTTTTAGPSTTTTTISGTTTTTLSPNCNCYEVVITSDGGGESMSGEITYLPCDGGSNMGRIFMTPGTYYQCARVIGGLAQIQITYGTGTITPVGSCNSGTCPPATTTTTAAPATTTTTTTTTTTAGPTTTTTTLPSGYYYYAIDKFTCPGCSLNQSGLVGRSSTLKTNGYYYNIGDGYAYRVNYSTGGTAFDVDLDGAASSGTNCVGTCNI